MSTLHHLALLPRDGFFAKDGRGWSSATRGHSVDWPWPTTVRGALTTAFGKRVEGNSKWKGWKSYWEGVAIERLVTLRRPHDEPQWTPHHRMWPVPADALWLESKDEVWPLQPKQPGPAVRTLGRKTRFGSDFDQAREALWIPEVAETEKPLTPPRWWPENTLADWLTGAKVATDRLTLPAKQWPSPERRQQAHVSIEPETRSAADGLLFMHDVIETTEPLSEWAIGVAVETPTPQTPKHARLGSDSRVAVVREIDKTLFGIPAAITKSFSKKPRGIRLMLTSPALFEAHGWLPNNFCVAAGNREFHGEIAGIKLVLRSAFVPRPLHISGWDVDAKAARKTIRLVPPGAVYFFERQDRKNFDASDAEALWKTSIGNRPQDGFGQVIPGIWNPLKQGT